MKRSATILALALLPPALALGLSACAGLGSGETPELGPVDGRLRPCPSPPNCVCSQDLGQDCWIEPLAFLGDPDATFASLVAFLESERRADVVRVDSDAGYIQAIYWTPFLKFVDDVEFLLVPAEKLVHVRSASRVGYSDLGTNRGRVESIRERWIPPPPSEPPAAEG